MSPNDYLHLSTILPLVIIKQHPHDLYKALEGVSQKSSVLILGLEGRHSCPPTRIGANKLWLDFFLLVIYYIGRLDNQLRKKLEDS